MIFLRYTCIFLYHIHLLNLIFIYFACHVPKKLRIKRDLLSNLMWNFSFLTSWKKYTLERWRENCSFENLPLSFFVHVAFCQMLSICIRMKSSAKMQKRLLTNRNNSFYNVLVVFMLYMQVLHTVKGIVTYVSTSRSIDSIIQIISYIHKYKHTQLNINIYGL